jgi:sec-independent protein translocase protein TatA
MIGGYDWLVVAGILVVVLLWGPQKLPELARSVGLAKKEFDKAVKETSSSVTTGSTTTQPASDPLIVAAKNLGIATEGKTKEEIAKEIADKTAPK